MKLRMVYRRCFLIGSLLGLTVLPFVASAKSPDVNQVERVSTTEGRTIYLAACATCHGIHGNGRGPGAEGFIQPATDFTQGIYKFRSTLSEFITTEELSRSVREGMSGTEMVPFKRILTDKALADVSAYLKTLSDKYDVPEAKPQEAERIEISADRPFPRSEASIAAGAEVFDENCSDCHGEEGEGNDQELDDWERPVMMIDFRVGYFKSGNADKDLYRSTAAGMPGTGMGPYSEELDNEAIWQVVDFIRSLSQNGDGFFGGWMKTLFVNEPNGFDYRDY